jgi:hypothetical protein
MNDEFLRRYWQRPRPEYAESLYQRISTSRPSQPGPKLSVSWIPPKRLALNVMLMGTLYVLLCAHTSGGPCRLKIG